MIFAIYDKVTGEIIKTIDAPEFYAPLISAEEGQRVAVIPRQARDATEYIKDGKLTPKPNGN